MRKGRTPALVLALLLSAGLAFGLLYRWDNKYTAALSGGLQADPEAAAFLVDGWTYYPGRLLAPGEFEGERGERTYIGQHPNLAHALGTPYGTATYRLVLKGGAGEALCLYVPEALCASRVYLGGAFAGGTGSVDPYRPLVEDGFYPFTAGEETELVIQTANYSHYYGGLYYPPAVGTAGAVARMVTARLLVYGLLCFASLALALSHLALWALGRRREDRLPLWLGLLCLCFALRVCYPFLRALGAPLVGPLYALEDLCGGAVVLWAGLIAGEVSGLGTGSLFRRVWPPCALGMCLAAALFPLFILPRAPLIINLYGGVMWAWKLLAGCVLLAAALWGAVRGRPLAGWLVAGCALYGAGLAANALLSGWFEPIRGAWPEEYGGFALVLCFAGLMVRRGVLLTAENQRLTLGLREEVDRKTADLTTLLAERKRFLADLVHDLKAPLAAVRSYAELIQTGGVGVDPETAEYLSAMGRKMEAVEDRFVVLREFSRSERESADYRRICLNDLLESFHRANRPDIELSGQTFRLCLGRERLWADGDPDQLRRCLENLCYNALSFTPEEGTITLSLERAGDRVVIAVRDTGAGIEAADLPHVFERGFTRRADGSGDGLGLFIAKAIVVEHGGRIEAASEPGRGSVFTVTLPLAR